MNLAPRSQREKLLLLIAALVAVGTGYLLFRARPMHAELADLRQTVRETRKETRNFNLPSSPRPGPDALKKDIAEAADRLERSRRQLDRLRRQFVPSDEPGVLQGLKLRISELARRTGVVVRESQPVSPDEAELDDPVVRRLTDPEQYGRPMQRLRLRASFVGLREFIEGLGGMRRRVIVARLEAETAEGEGGERVPRPGPRPLEVTLLLVL